MTLTLSIEPSSEGITAEWYDSDLVIQTRQATFCVLDSAIEKGHLLSAPPNQKRMIVKRLQTIERDVH